MGRGGVALVLRRRGIARAKRWRLDLDPWREGDRVAIVIPDSEDGMIIIDVEAAGARLPELIEEAGAGEEIVISRDGEPVAKLVPVPRIRPEREVDAAPPRAPVISEELFTPLPDDELKAWLQ